jgi:hypothetical protein
MESWLNKSSLIGRHYIRESTIRLDFLSLRSCYFIKLFYKAIGGRD